MSTTPVHEDPFVTSTLRLFGRGMAEALTTVLAEKPLLRDEHNELLEIAATRVHLEIIHQFETSGA